jgi:hypothetical protein
MSRLFDLWAQRHILDYMTNMKLIGTQVGL